ncbi:MAG: TrmH family RNA methyltransferase [Candidatus Pacebacteria bacterium]|nr:TrmH family RNA methyltransferase [Candidatus Paceibacterota bacterium]
MQKAVLLHNIRSVHNVGSIFRTSDGAGVSKVFLSGYSPTPIDQHGVARKDLSKVALGAEKFVPWEYEKNPYQVIQKLREQGWHIVGVEQDTRSIDYRTFKPKNKPVLYIFGNEVRGMSPALRAHCDEIVEIPMNGKKESLNVSVSAGIILFSA